MASKPPRGLTYEPEPVRFSQGKPCLDSRYVAGVTITAAIGLLVIVGLLQRQIEQRLQAELRRNATESKGKSEEDLQTHFNHLVSFFGTVASFYSSRDMSSADLRVNLAQYQRDLSQIFRISWLGPELQTLFTTPEELHELGEGGGATEAIPSSGRALVDLARTSREVVIDEWGEIAGVGKVVGIVAPIYRDDHFAGAVVALSPVEDWLRSMVSADILERYRVTAVDSSGAVVAELSSGRTVDERFVEEVGASPATVGLTLRLAPFKTGLAAYSAALKYLSLVLGLALSLGILALGRDIQKRVRVQEELRRSRDSLRNLAMHLESVREQERARIARDLHDELGRSMTTMKVILAWLERKIADLAEADRSLILERLGALSNLASDTLRWARRTASDLRPDLLDHFGVGAAIEWEAKEFQKRMGIRCHVHLPEDGIPVSQDQATALFRICQESLTNVARHAQATRVDVSLKLENSSVIMEIYDNGKGITEVDVISPRALGILGMQERARIAGGECSIHGTPGAGTTVVVKVPSNRIGEGIPQEASSARDHEMEGVR